MLDIGDSTRVDVDRQRHDGVGPLVARRALLVEKIQAVVESSTLTADDLGAFLRRKGLHAAQLKEWRTAVRTALSAPKAAKPGGSWPEGQRIRGPEKDLTRKDKALAEVTALLVLPSRRQLLCHWGDPGDL